MSKIAGNVTLIRKRNENRNKKKTGRRDKKRRQMKIKKRKGII